MYNLGMIYLNEDAIKGEEDAAKESSKVDEGLGMLKIAARLGLSQVRTPLILLISLFTARSNKAETWAWQNFSKSRIVSVISS